MSTTERTEARLLDGNNLLVAPSTPEGTGLIKDFFGSVITSEELSSGSPGLSGKSVYLCGDLSRFREHDLRAAERVFVIRELSHGHGEGGDATWTAVDLGQVPIGVHGLGVYYRRFFDPGVDHFHRICAEHTFQSLTESTKPEKAHRTGIYLTPVKAEGGELSFHLLRCSTNLSGPTENLRENDARIIEALNRESAFVFNGHAPLNHVLAQIYHNTPAAAAQKQAKAKISPHADKTKDMPVHGVMAFCTFYDQLDKLRPMPGDAFDYGYKGASGLTKLHFRLKPPLLENAGSLPSQFTLTLYPGSVFFMPLSTNRLYTHEIRSPTLDAEMLPTRLGYVVRCSKTEAVHKDGQTFIKRDGKLSKLLPPTQEGMMELRRLYAEENKTDAFIDYGDKFPFSMNSGDYIAPHV